MQSLHDLSHLGIIFQWCYLCSSTHGEVEQVCCTYHESMIVYLSLLVENNTAHLYEELWIIVEFPEYWLCAPVCSLQMSLVVTPESTAADTDALLVE